jgi:hypothetical protein
MAFAQLTYRESEVGVFTIGLLLWLSSTRRQVIMCFGFFVIRVADHP